MDGSIGKWLVVIGGFIVVAGVVIWLFGDHLGWLGKLPGDIRVERENFSFYFPVTTMIIVSIVLSIILGILRRFFGS